MPVRFRLTSFTSSWHSYPIILAYEYYIALTIDQGLFLIEYIERTEKKNISLEIIESICKQLHKEGIEIPGIILKIFAALKNPSSRESRQWMADPLFSQIVSLLSQRD